MEKIVLASSNKGKLVEFQRLLAPLHKHVIPQSDFKLTDAEETGLTFVENALIKARHASQQTGLPALADDSGLVVDALNGEPGIYSARYAGEHGNSAANITKLLAALDNVEQSQSTAHFHCTLVYLRHSTDPEPIIASGNWYGEITQTAHGDGGFGYDPIFYVPDFNCTAAELGPEIKNQHSHRAVAMGKLLKTFNE